MADHTTESTTSESLDSSQAPASPNASRVDEGAIYTVWENDNVFAANPQSSADPFTIMIPPPNVTGSLHVGHALTMTIQDTLTRWRRMQGRDSLWQPGTDHAGIATQMVVERQLAEKGVSRKELGRDAFIEHVWQWKAESGGAITKQLRRLGASLDWGRERFTMDDGLCLAVKEAFISLYKEGLIYRDRRLVNWDPKFQSAVSDLEVENKEVKGHLWYIRYPIAGMPGRFITIATTRPETMLADAAIAVHPSDARYKDLVGKHAILPLVGRELPIIVDEYSDPEKGTGAVKITPAHDFNDFAVGQRHQLATQTILTKEAKITLEEISADIKAVAGVADPAFVEALAGLDRFVAREKIIAELERLELLEKAEPHVNQVPHAERGGTIIEPFLTTQWFCNAGELAKPAIAAVENGTTQFVPKQWENTFFSWMRNIQPWCISRQLWWGHRIPAWYGPDGKVFVASSEAEAIEQAKAVYGGTPVLTQDEDVLDTWFSSALWPFSTLGWPEKTPDLARYYPGDVLVTGFDIIFFWVARMMMMGMHFMGEVPFKTVFMHGLVRDEHGQKMSKTKGNVMDPLVLMDTYGADAVRWCICGLAGPGRDIKLGTQRVEVSRNFVAKLRNAGNFCEKSGFRYDASFKTADVSSPLCRWLLSEMNETVESATKSLEAFRFDEYADTLYRFTWLTFCDWFIELSKPALKGEHADEVQLTGGYVLRTILALLHPSMPFVTEEIWEKFKFGKLGSLITEAWPAPVPIQAGETARSEINWLIRMISSIRTVRAEMNVPYSVTVPALLQGATPASMTLAKTWEHALQRLARVSEVQALSGDIPFGSAQSVVDEITIVLPLAGVIDLDAERVRLQKEITKVQTTSDKLRSRLEDPKFVDRAPAEVVEENRELLTAALGDIERLQLALARISPGRA